MRHLLLLAALLAATAATACEQFVTFSRQGNAIPLTQQADTIVCDTADWAGVRLAAANLRRDLKAVTGSPNAPVIMATVGKSPIATLFPQQARKLKGKWEQYIITNATVGGSQHIIILGSDKRGTIYGIYELSRQIGVSPWYWMADAPIARHDSLFFLPGTYTDGEPTVKYRGIFINDEWPSFGTWCGNRFGGINSKAYARIFELLLRLKANYFWPAMWNSSFNEDDPLSPVIADEMGIVMGTSHHEPMMRAHKEYVHRRKEVGPWDYSVNAARLDSFFTEGLRRNRRFDNIITIGMRGDGDVAMGKGDDDDNMRILHDVISSQRRIIKEVYGCPPEDVPQLWAIFTEVQRYYDAGFTVPDDVTLLFCDNNWGYIRRKGTADGRKRKGGMGLYYHIDMNGGPWNDRWINTTTIPKLREQLNLAYQSGLDRIWIVNVGDLKPKEVPIDFIMKYAWNPAACPPGGEKAYLEDFCASIFGERFAAETADIIARYSKYNLWRKPEVQYPGIFNATEAARVNSRWDDLEARTARLDSLMPDGARDAFFQLVAYPVMASAGVAKIYNLAAIGDSAGIARLMKRDSLLTDRYNHGIAGGKWNGMMLDRHIGYTQWSMPKYNASPMALGLKPACDIRPTAESSEYSISANRYSGKKDCAGVRWIHLPDLGRADGCMGADNVMADSHDDASGPYLEYDITTVGDSATVAIGILPTQDICPGRGLRLGVSIDGQPMRVIDARRGLEDIFKEYTPANLARSKTLRPLPRRGSLSLSGYVGGRRMPRRNEVFDNMRWLDVAFTAGPGKHKLRIHMVDPEIVVEQIVVNPDNAHYSYFGNKADI